MRRIKRQGDKWLVTVVRKRMEGGRKTGDVKDKWKGIWKIGVAKKT